MHQEKILKKHRLCYSYYLLKKKIYFFTRHITFLLLLFFLAAYIDIPHIPFIIKDLNFK